MKRANHLLILTIMLLSVLILLPSRGWSIDKIRVKDIGIGKYFWTNSYSSEVENWSSLGLIMQTKNYRINVQNPVSLGFFTGHGIQILPPREFKFTPEEGMFIMPQLGLDLISAGVAAGTKISDRLRLVSHLGATFNANIHMVVFTELNTHYESISWGVLPDIGTRLIFNDGISLGVSYRFGNLKATPYQDFKKAGDAVTVDSSTLLFTIALDAEIIR